MKKMIIEAVSRIRIQNAEAPDQPYSIISINCTGEEPAKLPINDKCLGTLVMHFDDITKEYEHLHYVVFNRQHAQQILDFILPLQQRYGNHLCIIHCGAGISRSQAVGAALSRIFNGEDKKFFQEGIPNRTVYHKILEQYYTPDKESKCQ